MAKLGTGYVITNFLFAAAAMAIETYDFRPAPGARFALIVYKTGLLSGKRHVFLFERYRGTLARDPGNPERSRVEMHIEAGSLVCTDTWVSDKDRQKIERTALEDMLAAKQHPELVFSSERVARRADGSYEVQGSLNIRGIAKPAAVVVRLAERAGRIVSASGESTVRLKDYGLKPPSAALGMIGTKNEMRVEFTLLPSGAAAGPQTGAARIF